MKTDADGVIFLKAISTGPPPATLGTSQPRPVPLSLFFVRKQESKDRQGFHRFERSPGNACPVPTSSPYPDTGVFSGDFSPRASVAAFSCSFNLLMSQSAFALTMLSSV